MEILEYIKSKIGILLEYNGVESVRYGVSQLTGSHIIEITPSGIFHSEEFLNIQFNFTDEFESLFPNEEIIFISNVDIIKLKDSLYSSDRESINVCLSENPNSLQCFSNKNIEITLNEFLAQQCFCNSSEDYYQLAA